AADIIMFDNQSPEEMKKLLELVPEFITTEASGGIQMENLASYQNTGVDYISLGVLTHSYQALDMSMKVIVYIKNIRRTMMMARTEHQKQLVKEINEWKEKRNAILLAHNYQIPEIQDIADVLGDSLALARAAEEATADVIVFCGVHFMAETAAILSPEKTVLLPDLG